MKRKAISWFTAIVLMIVTIIPSAVAADTNADITPPEVKSISVVNAGNVNADGNLQLKINLIEEGSGIAHAAVWVSGFEEGWGWQAVGDTGNLNDELLFTGTHIIPFKIGNRVPKGTYKITAILLEDVSGNVWQHGISEGGKLLDYFGDNSNEFTVTKSSYVDKSLKLNSFEILNPDNVDASKTLKIRVNVKTLGHFNDFGMIFCTPDGQKFYERINYDVPFGMWKSGTHTFEVPLNNELPIGKLKLYLIEFRGEDYEDPNGPVSVGCSNSVFYPDKTPKIFKNKTIKVTKSALIDKEIALLDLKFTKTKLQTPGVLKAEMEVETHGKPFKSVVFSFIDGDLSGWNKSVDLFNNVKKVGQGKYTVEIPVSPFIAEGDWTLRYVLLGSTAVPEHLTSYSSVDGNRTSPSDYSGYKADHCGSDESAAVGGKKITLDPGYDIAFFASLANKNLVTKIKNMKAGETAVIDCRYKKIVKKELFKAMAGRDVTVVFVNTNVQWVFNGKNIKSSRCKNIDLTSKLKVVNGETYGFGNDEKVALLQFPDNGLLPGEVEMRINYAYLAAKYKFSKNNMKLSSYKVDKLSMVEDNDVDMAKDNYYEYNIDHNSSFVLSKNKSALGDTVLKSAPAGLSIIRIKWNKCAGDGYYIYRSTKKDSGYKKIKTIKAKGTTSYRDKSIKKGKSYYYKIKPYSKKKAINKTAKLSKAYKFTPRLITTEPDTFKKNYAKKTMSFKWMPVEGAEKYEVYRSTDYNKTYKKVYTTKKCSYTDKKLVKGNHYFYKIKAIHSQSKYNGNLGPYVGLKY